MFKYVISILIFATLTGCAASEQQAPESQQVSIEDETFCDNILKPRREGETFDSWLNLLPFTSYWVLLEDEILIETLRELQNMDFDRGENARRFETVLQEYTIKRDSLLLRCQFLVDDPRLLNNGVTS